jgi:gliding motility-associated-like protein
MTPLLKSIHLLFCFSISCSLTAQLSAEQFILSTCGNEANFSNNQNLSWTLGEVIIHTGSQSNYHFTQGFHQGFPICDLVFNLSDSLIYCGLDSVFIDAGLYQSYAWNTGDTTQFLFTDIEGYYSIEVTDSLGCSAIDSFQLFLHDLPTITANVFEFSDGSGGDVELDVNGNYPFLYDWSNDGSGDFDDNEDQYGLSPGSYQVIIIDNNGCIDTIDVFIDNEITLFIPTGISPNADGVNDTWDIQGIESIDEYQVKILNRWGQVLYSSENNYFPWDGRYNGEIVPTSDYYYIVEVFSINKVFTGTLTVKY